MSTRLTRKQFLTLGLGATAAALLALPGCGDDGSGDSGGTASGTTGDVTDGPTGSTDNTETSGGTTGPTGTASGTDGTSTTATATDSAGSSGSSGSSSGASSSSGSGSSGGASLCPTPMAAIPTDPEHELNVTQTDIDAGVEKEYDITGIADHAHHVTLTADDFAKLAAGQTVMVVSTTDLNHNHPVTVSCG